ncbi:MAG: OmpA family protein [Bacteroidales bacterium]|nr:OmpA family protein [Bacteroidales bacterium]
MKSIKFIGLLAAASLLFSFNAFAQEDANRDEAGKIVRGPYVTNGAFDNMFIGVGAGLNSVLEKEYGLGKMGLATDLNLGKWFSPSVGIRAGWHGLFNTAKSGVIEKAAYNYFHGDLLWNVSNSIDGYKETRFWSFVPYASTGVLSVGKNNGKFTLKGDQEFAAGLGLLNILRLSERIGLTIDLGMLVTRASAFKAKGFIGGRYLGLPSATLGLSFNLGRTGFDRLSSVMPVIVPVPFTEDQYNALKDRVADLERENAQLKNKIADLENQLAPFKNLVDGQTYLFENGRFTAVEAKVVSPATVYFDLGSSKLSEREKAHHEKFAGNVVDADTELLLTGSADKQTGTARGNQKLSEQRVETVKNLLVNKFGANAANIETVANGDTKNVFDTPAKNRCVVIEVK